MSARQIRERCLKRQPGPRLGVIALLAGIIVAGGGMTAAKSRSVGAKDKLSNHSLAPFLNQHCQQCHSGNQPKGDFKIESLSRDFSDRKNLGRWLTVRLQLESGAMPPKNKPRPPVPAVMTASQRR